MQVGLIGCGNMARALARGWGRPVLCADPVAGRAQELAAEVGGEALASNALVAERAELVVLCHKPAQLHDVARELAPSARAVASILAAMPLEALRAAYPERPVYRFIPSLPVEVRQGAVVQAADPTAAVAGGDRAGCARRGGERAVRRTRHAGRPARRAARRGHGADVVRPGLRGAGRRGPGRRGRAQGHPGRAGRGARRADARRDRGAVAPARLRHGGGPPRGHLARAG